MLTVFEWKNEQPVIEYLPTRTDQADFPVVQEAINRLRNNAEEIGIANGVIYYGWPRFQDYDAVKHPVDIALLTQQTGLILIRCLPHLEPADVDEADDSIAQAAAFAEAQMLKSRLLRDKRRLRFDVVPVLYIPGFEQLELQQSEIATSLNGLVEQVKKYADQRITSSEFDEARSILEGAKALARSSLRRVSDPAKSPAAAALRSLEEEISKFDSEQRSVALTSLACPQRIRGLAGSGKTVILAMKAAMAHIENPESRILVTYYTRSLKHHLESSITKFYRHFADGDPDWKKIDVQHGWGQRRLPGVYREACVRSDQIPLSFGDAKSQRNPFDYVCKRLVASGKVKPYYDLVLIDEGQDFPEGFYQLCYFLTKGHRDRKQIVWAYDELQDIFDVHVRTSEELFGKDKDGEPRISLKRSRPDEATTNDFVLSKCYRNQREVLVLAHATGFGLYGQPVQMLQNREHWEDVGYEIGDGPLRTGREISIHRPSRNSPTSLEQTKQRPLIKVESFATFDDEVENCAQEFKKFIEEGLEPHDLLAITIDDRSARAYLSSLSSRLAELGISANNIIADKFNEPPFVIEGKVTLSTVYRAKGNEAALVSVLGCDAIPLDRRTTRNRIFTALTRTKGWLRVSGIEGPFDQLKSELEEAMANSPDLVFTMPDLQEIETIQRDLAERDARMLRAREEMLRTKRELGLSDDEVKSLFDEL